MLIVMMKTRPDTCLWFYSISNTPPPGKPRTTPKRNKNTPPHLQCQINLSPDILRKARLCRQTPFSNVANKDGRGILAKGYRCIKCAQKLLKTLDKAKHLLTCKPLRRQKILENALRLADEACPNMRTLETTCLTRFTSTKVRVGAYQAFKDEVKHMEGDFKGKTLHDTKRMRSLAASSFHLFYNGAQADGIVTYVGKPESFDSWSAFKAAAGGDISNIIDPKVLNMPREADEEAAVMRYLYGDEAVAAGYHGARIEATIYPWTVPGHTTPETMEKLYLRFVNACKYMQLAWEKAGFAHELATPVPDTW